MSNQTKIETQPENNGEYDETKCQWYINPNSIPFKAISGARLGDSVYRAKNISPPQENNGKYQAGNHHVQVKKILFLNIHQKEEVCGDNNPQSAKEEEDAYYYG